MKVIKITDERYEAFRMASIDEYWITRLSVKYYVLCVNRHPIGAFNTIETALVYLHRLMNWIEDADNTIIDPWDIYQDGALEARQRARCATVMGEGEQILED